MKTITDTILNWGKGGLGLPALILWVTIGAGFLQPVNAQQKPNWLQDHPSDPRYFIGIDGVSKTDSDYKTLALDHALSALISQIEVNVASTTTSFVEETNGEYSDLFSSYILSQAQQTIEEYQIVDNWESGDEYWIYIQLSKEKYYERLNQKIEVARSQGYTSYKIGLQQLQHRNYATALSSFMNGLNDVAPFIDRLGDFEHEGRNINLFAELRSSIQITLDHFRFEMIDSPAEVRIGRAANKAFSFKIVEKETGRPVEGIPVQYSFIRGEGEFQNPVQSNAAGIANGMLSMLISQDKLQIVQAKVALESFLTNQDENVFLKAVVGSLNAPVIRFNFQAKGIPAFINAEELFLGKPMTSNYLQPAIKNHFTTAGITFIENLNEAELFVELRTNARQGSENYGLFSVYLDYSIQVTDLLTGEEISVFSISDIKGMSDSYEKAAAKAYETGLDSLKLNIMPKLIARIQK